MAQAPPPEEDEQLSSFFPNPPPFYKHFTSENLNRVKQFKEERGITSADSNASVPQLSAAQLLELPTELRYLIPPEPPAEAAEYQVFGKKTKVNEEDEFKESVEWISEILWNKEVDQGILKDWKYQQLFPSTDPNSSWSSLDRQNYLFRFLRSIILSYIELLGIVASDPASEKKDEKLGVIMTLVLNMHALINEYRPHQARETLIGIMEAQLERKREEVEGVRRMGQRVKEVLEGFERDAPGKVDEEEGANEKQTAGLSGAAQDASKKDVQRAMWAAMDDILGP